jgi:hypothetical protein
MKRYFNECLGAVADRLHRMFFTQSLRSEIQLNLYLTTPSRVFNIKLFSN